MYIERERKSWKTLNLEIEGVDKPVDFSPARFTGGQTVPLAKMRRIGAGYSDSFTQLL